MLYPIPIILWLNHFYHLEKNNRYRRIIEVFLKGILILAVPSIIISSILYPFQEKHKTILIAIAVSALLGIIIVFYEKYKNLRLEFVIIALLLLRIAFNMAILPERYQTSRKVKQKQQALHVAEITKGNELSLLPWAGCSHETTFYITKQRETILHTVDSPPAPGKYYITNGIDPLKEDEKVIYSFETRWRNRPLRLVTFEK